MLTEGTAGTARREAILAWIVALVKDVEPVPVEDLVDLLMRTYHVRRRAAIAYVRDATSYPNPPTFRFSKQATSYPNPPTGPPELVVRRGLVMTFALSRSTGFRTATEMGGGHG